MATKAKHAFGSSENIQAALNSGTIDAYDILFLDGDTDPKIGWVDKNGNACLVNTKTDLSDVEAELATKADSAEVDEKLSSKADVVEVDAKIESAVTDSVSAANAYTDKMVEAAMGEHLTKKYDISGVPDGTLIDYQEREIRIMVPTNSTFTKQSVGAGGDPNCYYATFKTYVGDDKVAGYIEHLGSQVDSEIQTTFSTDEYGRRFQQTWLALAKYDEATGTWSYYGKNSSDDHYIGWDYQIDWYNSDGTIIASDCVRINLSNEMCHATIEPYYVREVKAEVETIIEEKIAEVHSAYEVIEF